MFCGKVFIVSYIALQRSFNSGSYVTSKETRLSYWLGKDVKESSGHHTAA